MKHFIKAGLVALCLAAVYTQAEEGMWTFDNVPVKQLQQKYGFTPTQQWLDHVRLASVRLNDGGSGSFISPDGLLLTNHHVARGQLQKSSTPEHNYIRDGFYAATRDQELKTPDLEINVLQSMENVTARVVAAVQPGMTDSAALTARRAAIAAIEKESQTSTGFESQVVSLYQGGEYWLYRYKKYTDVRIVFAPEQQTAFFGGDPDNFTYPRYDLDMAIFRVYDQGKPIHVDNYLKWNSKGALEHELVFVSGNPGSTDRDSTLGQLRVEAQVTEPIVLQLLHHRLDVLKQYSARGAEQARQAASLIFNLENSRKAYEGRLAALSEKSILAKKQAEEADFRQKVESRPELRKYGSAWTEIDAADAKLTEYSKLAFFRRTDSDLAGFAGIIVTYVAEIQKPDGERLPGFHDAQLESLRFRLESPAPVYPALEIARMTGSLEQARQELGADDEWLKIVLAGNSPQEAAERYISGTRLADASYRKELLAGGTQAVAASTDPLIELARKLDPLSRAMNKRLDTEVNSVLTKAGEKLGQARFAVYGKDHYPDATFTLRLSYGTVEGYPMNGTLAPPMTTIYGLYDRSASFGGRPPFDVPQRWVAGEHSLTLSTPLDFVTTNDIIGGNSGSPVINRNAEIVGLIFDGNIESLAGDFVYDGEKNRAVAVHTAAMMEALRKLYDAGPLADEIEGKAR
jgi:Peptidase S46